MKKWIEHNKTFSGAADDGDECDVDADTQPMRITLGDIDIEAIEMDLEELDRQETKECPDCKGTKKVSLLTSTIDCLRCKGTGEITS